MKNYLRRDEILNMLETAKKDEHEAMRLFVEKNNDCAGFVPNDDLELDKKGIDGWVVGKNGKRLAVQVKTYTFAEQYAINKGWWNAGQVACVELSGGVASACFLKECLADLVIFYYPGVESKCFHKIYAIEAEVVVQFAKDWDKGVDTPGRFCYNNRSKGSFVTVTLEDLAEYRAQYYNIN
jgi:hypothetical protein